MMGLGFPQYLQVPQDTRYCDDCGVSWVGEDVCFDCGEPGRSHSSAKGWGLQSPMMITQKNYFDESEEESA